MLQLSLIGQLIASLGLGALVVLGYGSLLHRVKKRWTAVLGCALLFTCGALAAMLNPIDLMPGVVIDARGVFLALAGPFGGVFATLVAGAFAMAFRLSVGGAGAFAGCVGILIAVMAGIGFRLFVPKVPNILSLLLLGAVANLMVFSTFLLKLELALPLFREAVFSMTVVNVGGIVLLGTVLSATRRANDHLRSIEHDAERDPLTNLLNRRALAEFDRHLGLDDEVSHGCVILFDIDRFKAVNDRFGHACGDHVLLTVARIIRGRVRRSDKVVRYGGEEIAVILLGASAENACRIAEQIRVQIEETGFQHLGEEFGITVSAGISRFELPDLKLDIALDFADRALYKAKNAGRNCIEMHSIAAEPSVVVRSA